jgi:hypothetical protein
MTKSRNSSRNNKRKQSGGRVSMPIEYFGGNSGRYFPEGSPELKPPSHAYGETVATSHGVSIPGNQMGPNLGAYPTSSGAQTGGGKRKRVKKMTGGRVAMPIEYYGGNSGRYSENPSPSKHSYGSAPPNSFGNNLGPHPGQSNTLTGGGSKQKSKSRSKSKKRRSSSKKRRSSSKKKRSISKKRRSSSKKKRSISKKRRSSGKKRRSSGKKRRSSSKSRG